MEISAKRPIQPYVSSKPKTAKKPDNKEDFTQQITAHIDELTEMLHVKS
jgi:hypothetical protein